MISAKIVADSKNEMGDRITTFVVTFPRIVLAEFNTHRMLSRNSASSRAIPFEKMLESVKTNPFIPIRWMKDPKGMQGTEFWEEETFPKANGGERYVDAFRETWLNARDAAVHQAKILAGDSLTKQICNRLLEPFMYHTVIVTATEWNNFFALRAHPAAEIHIQALAFKMLEAYNESIPKLLMEGEWHIPFVEDMDANLVMSCLPETSPVEAVDMTMVKISTAMCARTSFTVFGEEKAQDYKKDCDLHDKFLAQRPLHASPFEHCAYAMGEKYEDTEAFFLNNHSSGNFKGFVQYRQLLQDQNIEKDPRVKKK